MATVTRKGPATNSGNLTPEYLATLRYMTPIEAAAYLRMSRATLVILQREAEKPGAKNPIPFSKLSPRVIRFDRFALDKWAAASNAASQPA